RWHNRAEYYAYKFVMDYKLMPSVAWSLKRLICAVLGRVKKCLVLDLDNTLWGGVIGDDGVNGLTLGRETPEGEAYTEFQEYVKALKDRGVILAVCSKNDDDIARSGFSHPDSVLSVDDFVAFYANWDAKDVNIRRIAQEINIGLDSLVFIDDNPAERAIVRENVPEVSVPEVDPSDVASYIRAIEGNGFFDTAAISDDDLQRTKTYQQNKQRVILEESSGSYEDFLASLDMEAEIAPFREIYFDRIAQLTNKSNQFNLTTKRYTLADIKAISQDEKYITLYCRLKDRFGDNGVISLLIGEIRGQELHVILWLMSCRVLKRGVEDIMLDSLVNEAVKAGCTKIVGYYYPTAKNSMVKDHYQKFGFVLVNQDEKGNTQWELLTEKYTPAKIFIRRTQE
ncbi:MAG: HAD-IIIC family phosphatase, partial [Synergistaceae bacterium]|nr:HAD-IIIC family phosphatase [Synergistaceae bacterium]